MRLPGLPTGPLPPLGRCGEETVRAYRTIRFIEYPDVADIQSQARKSSVGRLDERGYIRNTERKRAIRRMLKRRDKANAIREGRE